MAEIIRSMNLISVFKQEKGAKRFFMMIFSILLMGFGISLFSYSDMGVDPFTSMNMAISGKIGISFGFYQMCINCVILIAIAFLGRHLIGFGTVVNMVGVGYICEFFTSLYDAPSVCGKIPCFTLSLNALRRNFPLSCGFDVFHFESRSCSL